MATNNEISDTTPLWWELQNIPTEVVRELRRRSNTNNIGMSIPTPFTNATFDFEKNYNKYKGPMTPWVRVFSNSTGKTINGMVPKSAYLNKNDKEKDYNGFLLKGGEGFFDAFGYEQGKPLNTKAAIIGYEADGTPHYIDNTYRSQTMIQSPLNADFPQNSQSSPIIPPPGLISVSVKQSKDHLTRVSFKFKCYGTAQLEYLTPFFLTAGINVFIEFGWNLFNQKSLLDLNNLEECFKLVINPQTALDRANKSNGNYGCISGLITKYSFTTTDGFVYDCNVDLTSRQAMYAGMKTDNSPKVEVAGSYRLVPQIDQFLDLKTFVKTYLPSINDVMREKVNFMTYVVAKTNRESDRIYKNVISDVVQPNSFYSNKPEDRVFTGRSLDIYKAKNIPDGHSNVIKYGNVTLPPRPAAGGLFPDIFSSPVETLLQISFADEKTDFDAKEGTTEVWMQLDFVFELVNLFMSNLKTNQNLIDISDLIISAHPNLISCDKHVLIPNPVSPKINKGAHYSSTIPFVKNVNTTSNVSTTQQVSSPTPTQDGPVVEKFDSSTTTSSQSDGISSEGFLKDASANPNGNPFLKQLPDITVRRNISLENRYEAAIKNNTLNKFYSELTTVESFYFAATSAMNTFKTDGRIRDDIDRVINYLYYNSKNNNVVGSASFPFATETTVSRKNKDGVINNKKYKQYYYGYLKHLYISKTKLIDIVKEKDNINYKQFIKAILTTINESVDNFWKFDIVEGTSNDKSILSIIDKNTSNFDELKSVYMFELGKTTNVVKGINFEVGLTDDQATQVQFGGQNSDNLKAKIQGQATLNPAAALTDLHNIPFLKFVDRMDKYQLESLISETSGSSVKTLVPGTSSGIVNDNKEIATLQTYGSKAENNVLCITTKQVYEDYIPSLESSEKVLPTTLEQFARSQQQQQLMNPNIANTFDRQARLARQNPLLVALEEYATTSKSQNSVIFSKGVLNDDINPKNHKYLCLSADVKGKLTQMLNDDDYKNNVSKYSGVADNFNITIKFDGIFSFRNLQVFAISNLPNPYVPGNIIFQILEVDHEISSGKWETTVTALVRCIGGTKLEYIPV